MRKILLLLTLAIPLNGMALNRKQADITFADEIIKYIPREILIQVVLKDVSVRAAAWAKSKGKPLLAYIPEEQMNQVWDISQKIATPSIDANKKAIELLKEYLGDEKLAEELASVLAAPIFEEIYYRYFIQHLMLKEVPAQIANRTLGKNAGDTIRNNPAVQAARVFTSAILFALGHDGAAFADLGGGFPQLLMGAVQGYEVEKNGGKILVPILRHVLWNYRALDPDI